MRPLQLKPWSFMRKRSFGSLFIVLSLFVYFTVTAAKQSPRLLNTVIKKYRAAGLVEMDANKIFKSELLDKKTESAGKIYLAKEKFRWDIEQPDKTQLIFDGITIWSVQHPSKEFPGALQVAKAKLDKKTQKQILISTLFTPGSLGKNFKIVNFSKADGFETYTFDPLTKEFSLKELQLKLNAKDQFVSELSYKDDVGNETHIQFSNVNFKTSTDLKLFKYAPPKGAQVTDL